MMPKLLEIYHFVWLQKHPERSEEWLRAKMAEGFHIHHVDGNHGNNDPANLVLMEGLDHLALHGVGIGKPSRKVVRGPRKKTPRRPQRFAEVLRQMTDEDIIKVRSGLLWA